MQIALKKWWAVKQDNRISQSYNNLKNIKISVSIPFTDEIKEIPTDKTNTQQTQKKIYEKDWELSTFEHTKQ